MAGILQFIPGIEKNGKPLSEMNQAVVDYRQSFGSEIADATTFKRKMLERYRVPNTYDALVMDKVKVPSKHPLKEFQHDGVYNAVDILHKYKGVIIADDMGLGKTIEAIVTAEVMKDVKTLLICVPANTIKQWQMQYYKWTGKFLTQIETKKQGLAFHPAHVPNAICSYEMLASLADEKAIKGKRWDMVIYDEIHKIRSRNAKMSLAARDIRDNMAKYVVGLTGSLQWGYTRDIWNPLRCVFRYLFGSADEFDFTYCGAFINEHGGKDNKGYLSSDGIDRSIELAIRLSYVSIRRTKADVKAELPSLTRNVIRIPPTQKATIALHAYLRKELPYVNAIMSTTSEKTEYVLELLEGLENALVFTYTKADVAMLAALISKQGKTVAIITGEIPKAERVAIISEAAKTRATIVATIGSTGVGVDGLQHVTSNVIFHSLSHSPKEHLQTESRAHRIGQDNPVVITYIVMQDSADEMVIAILDAKSKQDEDKQNSATEEKGIFANLKMDDAAMRAVLDDWVKNATDDIGTNDSNSTGWDDSEDEEYE